MSRTAASSRGFTLLELAATLAVIALTATLVLPRGDLGVPVVEASARRLADALVYARERAILDGRPMRVVLDLDRGGWRLGRPARDPAGVEPDPSTLGRPESLPARVTVRGVTVGGGARAAAGRVPIDLDPAGDALPVRVDLADARGAVAHVVLPAGRARPAVVAGGLP
jgi:prepilin-type N-terminal cleavage/methylation domain-containing protein